jgi:hypothetical protein
MESSEFNRDPEGNAEKSLSRRFQHAREFVNPSQRVIRDELFSAVSAGSARARESAGRKRAPRRTFLTKAADADFQERPLGRG